MKHCREDYQAAIVDIRRMSPSTKNVSEMFDIERIDGFPIPKDEPVFLLRAQDPFAAAAVYEYAARLNGAARNEADLAFARLAGRHADLMAAWPHKKAFPDAPGVNEPLEPQGGEGTSSDEDNPADAGTSDGY